MYNRKQKHYNLNDFTTAIKNPSKGVNFLGKNAISIRDVAKRSGVSIATVSNVLNNRCNVSDALRERVYRAVEELDYVRANPIARSMRSSRTFTVGVMVVDFLNCIFFAPLLKGIKRAVQGRLQRNYL